MLIDRIPSLRVSRLLLAVLVSAVAVALPGVDIDAARGHATNPIIQENLLPGTSAWRLTNPAPTELSLAGYASKVSVNHGGSVELYITNDAGPENLTLDVYRMGYYQGLGGRLIEDIPTVPDITQPACQLLPEPVRHSSPVDRTVSCANWSATYDLTTDVSWVTGDYLIKVTDARGYQTYIPLTVRDDGGTQAVLAMNSVTTWQAYNGWGGYSLYRQYDANGNPGPDNLRAYQVSFDRPYVQNGSSIFLGYEWTELSWLEREGYNVGYTTDVDVDQNPKALLAHKAVIALGKSEYWSSNVRSGYLAARGKGVSLMFLGADDIYRHVRYASTSLGSRRIVICYKTVQQDPEFGVNNSRVTTEWRYYPLDKPESQLTGQMYAGAVNPLTNFVVSHAGNWAWSGTGTANGERSPGTPVGTGDFDTIFPNWSNPKGEVVLGATPAIPAGTQDFQEYIGDFRATCAFRPIAVPTSMSFTARSTTAFGIWLMFNTPHGIIATQYDNYTWSPNAFVNQIGAQFPMDNQWHSLTVHPAADMAAMHSGPLSSLIGVWLIGQGDIGKWTISADGTTGTPYRLGPVTGCSWSLKCPSISNLYCGFPDWAGSLEGSISVRKATTIGRYLRLYPVQPVADTTLYSVPSGAYVFDAGNLGWGQGLSSAASPRYSWPALDGMMQNVLNRMIGTS